jgi:tetratricopeptide (TPR) repeat protein
MTWVPADPDASKLALSSAMISYKHLQLDDALKRFDVVFQKFCATKEAVQAKDGLLVIYESRGQNDKFEETNERFIQKKCGSADDIALADAQNKALRYRQAKQLFDDAVAQEARGESGQAKFLDAGQAFYAYFMEVSDDNPDKDDALFAAAVAFSRGGRPKTAISLYQIFLEKKEFKTSEYYVEAMFLIAKNYQNAFEYEKAADTFLQVYKVAGEKGRKAQKSFDLKQARLDSLYNAAYLREVDRVYVDRSRNDLGAISLYKQYAKEEPDPLKAADAYVRIPLIYKKQGKPDEMLREFGNWRKTYAKDPAASPSIAMNYVLGFYEQARLEKSVKLAAPLWQGVIDAYDKVFNDAVAARFNGDAKAKYGTAQVLAREWAGEAQFRLADKFYKENFEPWKFKWKKLDIKNQAKTEKAIDESYKALYDIHEKTIREFLKVGRFQSTWASRRSSAWVTRRSSPPTSCSPRACPRRSSSTTRSTPTSAWPRSSPRPSRTVPATSSSTRRTPRRTRSAPSSTGCSRWTRPRRTASRTNGRSWPHSA